MKIAIRGKVPLGLDPPLDPPGIPCDLRSRASRPGPPSTPQPATEADPASQRWPLEIVDGPSPFTDLRVYTPGPSSFRASVAVSWRAEQPPWHRLRAQWIGSDRSGNPLPTHLPWALVVTCGKASEVDKWTGVEDPAR